MIYLDNSSTTKQYDEVSELIRNISNDNYANPSSIHSFGNKSRKIIEQSRDCFSKYFNSNGEIIFTSGGTESDNMAIFSSAKKLRRRGNKVITSKIEHPAVLESCKALSKDGFNIIYLDVDDKGLVNIEQLSSELDKETILVSIMTVNNEIGTIEPVIEISKRIRDFNNKNKTNIIFHTDAVQAFGKIDLKDADFDLISVSGHKFHAPKGVGALYMKKELKLPPYIYGGGQEKGYRSSTENINGIAGISLAADMAYKEFDKKNQNLAKINQYLFNGLTTELSDIKINGEIDLGNTLNDFGKRCPSVLNVSFLGTRAEVILHTLEQDEIFVSTGSACSSHENSDSHVLKSLGMEHKEIEGAIRFSFSEFNTIEEMDFVIDRTKTAVNRFRKLGTFR